MLRFDVRAWIAVLCVSLVAAAAAQKPSVQSWPNWRGPSHSGAATGNPPLTCSDTSNVKWKVEIPGRGSSTPVAWGDRLFLTTAIPTGKKAAEAAPAGGGGRAGGGSGAG